MVTMMMAHLLSRHLYFRSSMRSPPETKRGKWAKYSPQHVLHKDTPCPCPLLSSHPHSLVGSSFLITKLETEVQEDVEDNEKNDFYVNLGSAVRTLREDLPLMFTKDLNYGIYREDISFIDPLNRFNGIENYKLIFSALRFHGRILFKEIWLEICKVWQLSENVILIRWTLHGIPRVPWESRGQFQGTSRYKLDRKGKIYEHKVDNLVLNFPKKLSRFQFLIWLLLAALQVQTQLSFVAVWVFQTILLKDHHGWSSIWQSSKHWIKKVISSLLLVADDEFDLTDLSCGLLKCFK